MVFGDCQNIAICLKNKVHHYIVDCFKNNKYTLKIPPICFKNKVHQNNSVLFEKLHTPKYCDLFQK